MKLFITTLFTIIGNYIFSQTTYSLFATILSSNSEKTDGDFIVLKASDSSFVSAVFYMEGNARIEGIKEKDLLVKIVSFGYNDTLIPVKNTSGQDINLGTINLKSLTTDLTEVQIVASVPMFAPQTDGSLNVNVQKTILGSSITLLEVLSKTPNVQVEDGGLSIVGKGKALIYLDGKRIPFERINSIQVSRVDKIQLITNPSSKYDAEGMAVINILTLPNPAEGFSGVLIQNTTQAKHFLSSTALLLDYRKGRFSFSGDYSANFGKDWNHSLTDRTINTTSGTYLSNNENEENTRLTYVSNYRLGVDFRINNKSNLSAEYTGLFNIFDLNVNSDNSVSKDLDTTRLSIFNNGNTTNRNHSVNLNYNNTLDSLGSSLFIGGQFSQFSTSLLDRINEDIYMNSSLTTSADRKNVGANTITIATPQLDYHKQFKNSTSLEVGAKYSFANNTGKVDLYSRLAGEADYSLMNGYSNNFEYTENVPAIYAQYNGKLKGEIEYHIGARAEYTDVLGVSRILNKTVIDSSYLNIFPNVAISKKLSEKWNTSLSYAERINRPQYQSMDPFIWYQDSLTSVQGNPLLIPALTHSFEGVLNYKDFSFKAGYNRTLNQMRFGVFEGNSGENSVVLKQFNIDLQNSYFTSLSIPLKTKKIWTSFNTLTLTYEKIVDDRPEFNLQSVSPQFYFYTQQTFNIPKIMKIEVIGEYEGAKRDGLYYRKDAYSLTIGLSRGFLNNSLMTRFVANDILHSYREAGSYTIGSTSVNYNRKLNTRFFRLSLVWYFGKLQEITYSNKATGSKEFERIKQ